MGLFQPSARERTNSSQRRKRKGNERIFEVPQTYVGITSYFYSVWTPYTEPRHRSDPKLQELDAKAESGQDVSAEIAAREKLLMPLFSQVRSELKT